VFVFGYPLVNITCFFIKIASKLNLTQSGGSQKAPTPGYHLATAPLFKIKIMRRYTKCQLYQPIIGKTHKIKQHSSMMYVAFGKG
jgi:hypothetical protein